MAKMCKGYYKNTKFRCSMITGHPDQCDYITNSRNDDMRLWIVDWHIWDIFCLQWPVLAFNALIGKE